MACSSVVENDGTFGAPVLQGRGGIAPRTNRGLIGLKFGFICRTSSAFSVQMPFPAAYVAKCDRSGRGCVTAVAVRTCPFWPGFRRKPRHRRHRAGRRVPSSAGRCARRNGLVASSSDRRDGTVGRPFARAASTSPDARDKRRHCRVQGTAAKRRFEAVYSWPEQTSVSGGRRGEFRAGWPTSARAVPSNSRPQPPAIRLSAVKARPASREVKGDVAEGVAGHVDHAARLRRRWRSVMPSVSARSSGGRRWASAAAPSDHRAGCGAQCRRRPEMWSSW